MPHEPVAASPWVEPNRPSSQAPASGKGLAITAIVLSGIALILVLVIGAVVGYMFFAGAGYDNYTLRGQVEPANGRVANSELERAIRVAIEDDGGTVSKVACPESSAVGSGLSVMCDATIDDAGWVVAVVFENDQGEFALSAY